MTDPLPDNPIPERATVIPIGNAATLPAPLVPAEVDLRDFPFMPLDVLRLRDSDLSSTASGDEFKAAVLLWCAAWHQTPAASVPANERWLAKHSGAGALWKKVRDEAMRNFVLCDDGRYYHRIVAEKALESWKRKQEQRERTRLATEERARRRREHQQRQRDEQGASERDVVRNVERDVVRNDGRNVHQGTGTGTGTGTGIENQLRPIEAVVPVRPTLPPGPPGGGPAAGRTPEAKAEKPDKPRATRLPKPWQLPDEWRDWACTVHHLEPQRVVRMSLGFRDYWWAKPGREGTKLDWAATWRNWVRKECNDA